MSVGDEGYSYGSFTICSNVSFAFAKISLFNIFIWKHKPTIFVHSTQRNLLETQKQKDSLLLIFAFKQHKKLN